MAYRPDIDGLRAIAVLSVIVYHAFPNALPGGFVGVDIFFVISGYLITQIILRERASGQFSYAHFYTRRIKRILPAVWAVIFFSTVVAMLLFPIDQYLSFFWSALSSVGFIANHYFASSYGYFNSPGDHTLLLHLWSLSVEEQFYIIWPTLLLVIAGAPFSTPSKLIVLGLFALLSFVGAHLMSSTGRFENDGFYLLPPRAGEFLAGCIVAVAEGTKREKVHARNLGWLGVSLLLISLTFISRQHTFPGLYALLPCLGAALLLSHSAARSTISRAFLSAKPVVYVGKISYSLYLWHWPLLVIPGYLFGTTETITLLALLALSIVLAHLSWVFIEMPIRRSRLSFQYDTIILAAGWVIYHTGERRPANFDFWVHLENQMRYWLKTGKRIIVMAQVPWYLNNSVESHRNIANIPTAWIKDWAIQLSAQKRFRLHPEVDAVNARLQALASRYVGVYYLDPMANTKTVSESTRSPYFQQQMLYQNGDHLSIDGSETLATLESSEFLRDLLGLEGNR